MVTSSSGAFIERNAAGRRAPRYVIEVDIDGDGTDIRFFTSDGDIVTPDESKTIHNVVRNMPVVSQILNPLEAHSEIGYGSLEFVDIDDDLTDFLAAKFSAGVSARKKQVKIWSGFEGMEFADFDLTGVQDIDSEMAVNDDYYDIQTADIQRTLTKKVFKEQVTTLKANLDDSQTYVFVDDPSDFPTLKHDTKFSHLASQTVGYIRIKKSDQVEKIVWLNKLSTAISVTETSDFTFSDTDDSINSTTTNFVTEGYLAGMGFTVTGTTNNNRTFTIDTVAANKITFDEAVVTETPGGAVTILSDTQFYNCTRGVLNTKAMAHEVDLTAAVDRRTPVTEHIYFETNALKLIYAIYTGLWYGTADVFPWNLGIDTTLVEASQFTEHFDLWDTTTDNGFILRFEGESETDAKEFLEEQLFFPVGAFQRVLNTGKLGFKRYNRIITGAATVGQITQADIRKHGKLRYALADVANEFEIHWNYDSDSGTYTRESPIFDLDSQSKYGVGDRTFKYTLRGLHGSVHTMQTVFAIADMIRDRYAAYPKKISVTALPGHSRYEPGDVIRLTLDHVKDHTNNTTKRLDSAFEVQKKTYNPNTGEATYELFGSSEASTPIAHWLDQNQLADSYYTSEGADATSTLTGTSSGGTFTMTANGTLTGHASLTHDDAIFSIDENFTIADGVTLTIEDNVQLRVMGLFTCNGLVDGKGNGIVGVSGQSLETGIIAGVRFHVANPGTSGFVGTSQSGGGFRYGGSPNQRIPRESPITVGENRDVIPWLPITNVSGTSLGNLPNDIRGTSGGTGGPVTGYPYTQTAFGSDATLHAAGGAGGAGGAGLFIVCRGMTFGVNGDIDCSGAEGATGAYYAAQQLYAGSGAPGSPGAVYCVIDNYTGSTKPDNQITADVVQPQIQGTRWEGTDLQYISNGPLPGYSYYTGTPDTDAKLATFLVQPCPEYVAAEEDVNSIADKPLSITVSEASAGENSPNTVNLLLSATPPTAAGNYDYSRMYIRESGQVGYTYVGDSASASDTVIYPGLPGKTYDVLARSVSLAGEESREATTDTHSIADRLAFKSTPSFGENNLYFETAFEALDSFNVSTNTTLNSSSGGIRITKDSTSGTENTYKILGLSYGSRQMSIGNHVRFQALLGTITTNAQTRMYVATGGIGARAYGFRHNGTTWQGFTDNGTSTYTTLSTVPTAGAFVEAEFVPSTGLTGTVYFYVDGVQVGSQAVTWGVDTTSEYVGNWWVQHAAAAGGNSILDIITYKYLQKF